MTATARVYTNPFVGPRSFRRGDALYGRDQEVGDLLDLLIAERVVLLHSPSGAGKTSLIQASLLSLLELEGFEVLPVIRLTHEVPAALIDHDPPVNRYVLSALLSLEEGVPSPQQRPLTELAGLSLAQYLAEWPDLDDRPGNEVLVFDQFEEVITVDPVDHEAKKAFFADLGATLRDRSLWSLFSMREDFVAELDPYARHVPTRFSTRFRLDLLTVDQALEAVTRPAREAGVEFEDEAAVKLVDDLRRVRTQRGTRVVEELGRHVEPVQLQVSCRQIWDGLGDAGRIGIDDIESVGDVNEALAAYYAACVATVVQETEVPERALRDWFERELVTSQGFRGQVLGGPESATEAGGRVLELLTEAHLLRAESRRGAVWYELAHDRLTQPIEQDNARWREQHLSHVERRASDWDAQGRPDHLLLVGPDLDHALRWESQPSSSPTRIERDYLAASVKAQQQRDDLVRAAVRTRRWLRLSVGLLVLAVIAAVLAIVSWFKATEESERAEDAANESERSALVTQAGQELATDPARALRTALDAWTKPQSIGSPRKAEDTLRRALSAADTETILRAEGATITTAAFSDEDTLVTSADDGRLRVYDVETGRVRREVDVEEMTGLAGLSGGYLVNHGQALVAGSEDGGAALIPVDGSEPQVLRTGSADWTFVIVPSAGPRPVALTIDSAGRAAAWNVGTGARMSDIGLENEPVATGAVSTDGRYAATWTWSGHEMVRVWDTASGSLLASAPLRRALAPAMTFLPGDSPKLATVNATGKARGLTLWDWKSESRPQKPRGLGEMYAVAWVGVDGPGRHLMIAADKSTRVMSLADSSFTSGAQGRDWVIKSTVSPDGRLMATATRDGEVVLDYADRTNPRPLHTFMGHGTPVFDVEFSPSGDRLASMDRGGVVRIWRVPERVVDWGAKDETWMLDGRFVSGGEQIVAGSESGEIHFTDASTGEIAWRGRAPGLGSLTSVDSSPDGGAVVVTGTDTTSPIILRRDGTTPSALSGGPLVDYVEVARWSPDPGSRVIVGGGTLTGKLAAWDVDQGGEPLWTTPEPPDGLGVTDLRFTPRGDEILALMTDGQITVLAASDGDLVRTIDAPPANSIAAGHDGRYVATAGADGLVRIYDLERDEDSPVRTLEGASGTVARVAFSHDSDSSRIAAVSSNGTTYVWERESGKLLAAVSRHSDAVNAVDFDPENRSRIMSASDDGSVAVYSCTPCDLDKDQLEKAARNRLPTTPPE